MSDGGCAGQARIQKVYINNRPGLKATALCCGAEAFSSGREEASLKSALVRLRKGAAHEICRCPTRPGWFVIVNDGWLAGPESDESVVRNSDEEEPRQVQTQQQLQQTAPLPRRRKILSEAELQAKAEAQQAIEEESPFMQWKKQTLLGGHQKCKTTRDKTVFRGEVVFVDAEANQVCVKHEKGFLADTKVYALPAINTFLCNYTLVDDAGVDLQPPPQLSKVERLEAALEAALARIAQLETAHMTSAAAHAN